jgi:hypothetical protein
MTRTLINDGSGGKDLSVDYDGLGRFADGLDVLQGQWNGSRPTLDPTSGLGNAPDLTEAVADFTREWAAAAKIIDGFMSTLSGMCRKAVEMYTATDQNLANTHMPAVRNAHADAF